MNQRGLENNKHFGQLTEKEVYHYHPTNNNRNTYSKKILFSNENNISKANITKNASRKEIKSAFVLFQNTHRIEILPRPHIPKWNFMTKLHLKKNTESKYGICHRRVLSQNNNHNNNPSLSSNSFMLSSPAIKPYNPHCGQTTKRTYLSTKSNYEMMQNPNLSNTVTTSHGRRLKTKSVNTFRLNNSSLNFNNSAYCDHKKEFYIKYQKIPYLKSLNLSTMSVSSPTITTCNMNKSSSKRLKLQIDKDNNVKNDYDINQSNNLINSCSGVKKLEEQKYSINNDIQLTILKDTDISIINNKKENATTEAGNNNNNNVRNNHNNTISHCNHRYLPKKNLNFDHFINIKTHTNVNSSNVVNTPIRNKARIKTKPNCKKRNKKEGMIHAYNESKYKYEYDFPKLIQYNRKNHSISPNKRLFSFLFKDKEKFSQHNKSLSLIAKSIKKRDQVSNNNKNISYYLLSNNTQFTYEAIPVSQKKMVDIELNCNITQIAQYEIYHNDNITIVNNTKTKDDSTTPNEINNEFDTFEVDFAIENSNNESMTSTNQINIINIQEIPHFKKKINSPALPSLPIKDNNRKNEPIALIEKDELEVNIVKLKPIDTGKSINDSLRRINIHINKDNTQPKLDHNSNNFNSDTHSIPSKPKYLSIEEILEEVKQLTREQFNTISSFDLTNSSSQTINYLFHLNNQNISYIKRLLSVESIIPKGNLQRFTILKKNASLQGILLHELSEIKTKKEKSDNINLIIELIGNSHLILDEIIQGERVISD